MDNVVRIEQLEENVRKHIVDFLSGHSGLVMDHPVFDGAVHFNFFRNYLGRRDETKSSKSSIEISGK